MSEDRPYRVIGLVSALFVVLIGVVFFCSVYAADIGPRRDLLSAPSWVLQGSVADDYFATMNCADTQSTFNTPRSVPCASHYQTVWPSPSGYTANVSQFACEWQDGHLSYITAQAAATYPVNPSNTCITDKGLGAWEGRTNLLLYSAGSGTGWTHTIGSYASGLAAPDGTSTAASGVATAQYQTISAASTAPVLTAATQYTASCYLKAATASYPNVTIQYYDTVSLNKTQTFTVGTTWARYSYTFTTGASIGTGASFGVQDNNSSAWQTIYAWGCQVEANTGGFATPYIPTTASAVTRPASNIQTVSTGAMDTCLRATPGAVFVQTNGVSYTTNNIVTRFVGNWYGLAENTASGAYGYDGTTFISVTAGSGTWASRAKISYTYNGANTKYQWNAGTIASNTGTRTNATGLIYIGSLNGTSNYMNGYLERLACGTQYQLFPTNP